MRATHFVFYIGSGIAVHRDFTILTFVPPKSRTLIKWNNVKCVYMFNHSFEHVNVLWAGGNVQGVNSQPSCLRFI